MKKPEELEMSVLTVPNGYSLDLRRGGKESGYLYFTLPQLLEHFGSRLVCFCITSKTYFIAGNAALYKVILYSFIN